LLSFGNIDQTKGRVMREEERSEDEAIDPPENQGGGSKDGSMDKPDEAAPIDPPSNSGNTTLSDL
jgi:hypothetical protein